MMQYAALLCGKQGRSGFLLIAQAPRRAPGLIAEARAGDAEVGFAPHASGPGEASAGGAQCPGDLRMYQKGLFVIAVEGGGDVRQHFRVGLPRRHRHHMGLSRPA